MNTPSGAPSPLPAARCPVDPGFLCERPALLARLAAQEAEIARWRDMVVRMLANAPYGQATSYSPVCRAAKLLLAGDVVGADAALEPFVESAVKRALAPEDGK